MDNRRVIVALDFPSAQEALACALRLDARLCRVKVGKELFVAAGPALVAKLQERGFEVFLDLKFHDIPNTVASACKAAAGLGVWMVNVHASGGEAMLRAASDAVAAVTKPPLLIAVTILTSLDDEGLRHIGFADGVRSHVEGLSRMAKACGLDGVVCSAKEAPWVRAAAGSSFTLVTPGIRLAGDAKGDQARVATPPEALRLGADYLVIGRSITRAADPGATLEAVNRSLEAGASVQ